MPSTVHNKVVINGDTYLDLSQDTVADASHIRQGYRGHLNDGTQVDGTYTGGSSKNAQTAPGFGRISGSTYTAVSGQSITVSKTGTYDVYWTGYRSSTTGTSGSCLYVNNSAHSSGNQETFDTTLTNCQAVHLSNVSLTQGDTIEVRARARGGSYYMHIFGLTIIEA